MSEQNSSPVEPGELSPLATSLELGGYRLISTTRGSVVDVSVEPGPEACVECLVPVGMFRTVVEDLLRDTGLTLDRVTYPKDAPEDP